MNKPQKLISIIIPIYNAEKYLSRCINSLICQTYKNIEIICVNDGSKDNSYNILQKMADTDSRIVIINQENLGVSAARNNGMKYSKGEYLMFLDADDWFDSEACEKALNKIETKNYDVVCFNYKTVINGKFFKIEDISVLKNLKKNTIPSIICRFTCAIYNKKFLVNNKIYFPINIKNHEDIVFSMKMFSHAQNIGILSEYFYNYVINEDSTTHNFEKLNSQDALDYWLTTNEYKNQTNKEKLKSIDIFAQFLFGYWSDMKSTKYKIQNEIIISNMLKKYEQFDHYNLLKYVGYRRLKFKIIYKHLKKLKYFILNIMRGI